VCVCFASLYYSIKKMYTIAVYNLELKHTSIVNLIVCGSSVYLLGSTLYIVHCRLSTDARMCTVNIVTALHVMG